MSLAILENPDYVEIVESLLQRGADANLRHANGSPPLHQAIYHCLKDVVVAFLSAQVDVNTVDAEGNFPMAIAVVNGMYPDGSILQNLVEAGADLNTHHRNGSTPLHYAVGDIMMVPGDDVSIGGDRVDEAVVSLLLRAGGDAMAENGDGKMPADLLAGDETNKGVRLLLHRAAAWRRRRWVVMLWSRAERLRVTTEKDGCAGNDMEARTTTRPAEVIGSGSGGGRMDLFGIDEVAGANAGRGFSHGCKLSVSDPTFV